MLLGRTSSPRAAPVGLWPASRVIRCSDRPAARLAPGLRHCCVLDGPCSAGSAPLRISFPGPGYRLGRPRGIVAGGVPSSGATQQTLCAHRGHSIFGEREGKLLLGGGRGETGKGSRSFRCESCAGYRSIVARFASVREEDKVTR
jgi:hypothetical protein